LRLDASASKQRKGSGAMARIVAQAGNTRVGCVYIIVEEVTLEFE
jgi:hypothetical protein